VKCHKGKVVETLPLAGGAMIGTCILWGAQVPHQVPWDVWWSIQVLPSPHF